MWKKVVAAVAAIVMTAGVMAGCSNNAEQTNGTEGGKMKLSWATWVTGPVDENSYVEQELEKLFPDIDFEFLCFERATFKDQLNTRIAGGDIPDIIYRTFADELTEFAKQKIIAEVPYELIKENAPNIFNATIDYGTEVWFATMYEGKNYGVPAMNLDQTYPSCNGWRMDWLENVGITKVPETLEEYEEAFDRFVNNDPDGNGVKDTYAMTARGMDQMYCAFTSFFMANGAMSKGWMTAEDGTVTEASLTQGARDTLELLAKWYQAGYIDPEFVTTDGKIFEQKWNNSKVGFAESQWYQLGAPNGGLYKGVTTVTPDAEVVMGPAPKGPDGEYGYMSNGKITSSLAFGAHMAEQPEKLARALQVIDKITSDVEVYKTCTKGQEGVHYEFDEKGYTIKLEPYETTQKLGSVGTLLFTSWAATPEVAAQLATTDKDEQTKFAKDSSVVDGEDYSTWIYVLMTP